MSVKMYGINSCHDCIDAENILNKKNIKFEYLDFAKEPLYLKSFLQLRDKDPFFKEVRENGYIGIPCFLYEDGTMTFNVNDVITKYSKQ